MEEKYNLINHQHMQISIKYSICRLKMNVHLKMYSPKIWNETVDSKSRLSNRESNKTIKGLKINRAAHPMKL